MKRKGFIILLALMLLIGIVPKISLADDDLSIWVDGKYVTSDSRPFIEDGRTLVPVRFVAESLGYKVSWDEKNSAVIIDSDDDRIVMVIGSASANHNGKITKLNKAPKLQNSRTYIPVRDVAERFGKNVDWDEKNWTVIIGTGYKAPTSVPIPGRNGRISIERAIEIAKSKVNGIVTGFEFDDGEYEIEIYKDGYEYEFEINAYTGAIKELDREREDDIPSELRTDLIKNYYRGDDDDWDDRYDDDWDDRYDDDWYDDDDDDWDDRYDDDDDDDWDD